jgi:hypothetical protein
MCVTHYPDDDAFELEYSPYGVDSGLCMGTAATAVDGSYVFRCSGVMRPPGPSGSSA